MLNFLHIENIAVAKNIDITFSDGFNVLSGETGAGKSIIIDSINMILGAKMSKDIIRHGEDRATVSALFSNVSDSVYRACDELEIPYDKDDLFSVSRTITGDGKNTVKINSRLATLTQLKAIGLLLVNIHGQNENQSFMNKANHIKLLDEYIDDEILMQEYKAIYNKLNLIKTQITKLYEENKQKNLMNDALKYQIKEICSARLKDIDEEEKLLDLRNKLKSAENIIKNTNIVYKALFKSESGINASVLIEKAIEALQKIESVDDNIENMISKLTSIVSEIEEIAEYSREIGSFDGVEDPNKQLDIVEERLALIQRLEKKYGPSIKDIQEFKENAEKELQRYENIEQELEELKKEYKALHAKGSEIAEKIHNIRANGARKLEKIVKDALVFLDMPKVKFEIAVKENIKDGKVVLSSLGYDDVEFMIATNGGDNLYSMNKIASGGELARIMLAMKSALSDKNGAQTVIFDEIDTGVSGSTSQKIGYKLVKISETSQVICVTHSAQIVAFASQHLFIKKYENAEGKAETKITVLNEQESIEEITRIIGGSCLTDNQFAAAKELIEESKALLNNK